MMKYDHIGIPTTQEKDWLKYVEGGCVHVSDPSKDEFGVEWLKFDANSPMPAALQQGAHIAFTVDCLDSALAGKNVMVPPFEAGPGVRCAFIDHDGVPVELVEKAASTCGCGR